MGTKKITGDLDITGTYKINGETRPNGNTITTVGTAQLETPSGWVRTNLKFNMTSELEARIKAAKIVIVTMNNTFILTVFQDNLDYALACGSFAYDSSGTTRMYPIKLFFDTDSSTSQRYLKVEFYDYGFSISPYGALLIVE